MSIDIKSPTFPESVADGTIATWLKNEGDAVTQDEVIAEIETDKVVLEVVAPSNGILTKIIKAEGDVVQSAEKIGEFSDETVDTDKAELIEDSSNEVAEETQPIHEKVSEIKADKKIAPAAKKIIKEKELDVENIKSSGKGNRVTKADVINHLDQEVSNKNTDSNTLSVKSGRQEKRVPMSRLRSTIAKRLVSVKQETAMLTTFNEVDMLPIKELRKKYGQEFEKEHGVKLGFMGP